MYYLLYNDIILLLNCIFFHQFSYSRSVCFIQSILQIINHVLQCFHICFQTNRHFFIFWLILKGESHGHLWITFRVERPGGQSSLKPPVKVFEMKPSISRCDVTLGDRLKLCRDALVPCHNILKDKQIIFLAF